MEYFLIGCGFAYYLKRKKYISFTSLKKIPLVDNMISYKNQIIAKDAKNLDMIRKSQTYEYTSDKEKINEYLNRKYNVLSFKSVTNLSNLSVETDADEYGGDTVAELNYNIEKEAVVVSGYFEMKNKHLIDYDKMFAKVQFRNLPFKYFDYVNLIRVCLKTNGHVVKLILEEDVYKVNLSLYKAYVKDQSKDFRTYEIPLKNLRLANQFSTGGNHILDNFTLNNLYIEIESKTEGPFEVEIKSVDFLYNHKINEVYRKYKEPLFVRI